MEQRTRRILAGRLMAFCRTHKTGAYNTYQFQQRIVTNADGTEHDQTLFADGFVLLDVTPLMDFLTHADGEQGVDAGHWHDPHATDFRHVDLAHAWDKWEAVSKTEPHETLDPLNLYTYYMDNLCQWFSVVGSDQDDSDHARRVLLNTEFLNLVAVDRDALQFDCIATMAADGRVRIENDAEGVVVGYVMPIGEGARRTEHSGQMTACKACGGDGDYHPVRVDEAVTA